jgi:hypothetical protein
MLMSDPYAQPGIPLILSSAPYKTYLKYSCPFSKSPVFSRGSLKVKTLSGREYVLLPDGVYPSWPGILLH